MHNCGSKLTSCGPSITDQAAASQRVLMQLQESLQNIAEATQANASCALLTHLMAMTDYSIRYLSLCIEAWNRSSGIAWRTLLCSFGCSLLSLNTCNNFFNFCFLQQSQALIIGLNCNLNVLSTTLYHLPRCQKTP
jgi:hypothetical protein